MEARITPTHSLGYTHAVPGVQPFATCDLMDAEGSKITLQFHQPESLNEFADMIRELATALTMALIQPMPTEGDTP